MYTYNLVKFYDIEYDFDQHGISFNGKGSLNMGGIVNVLDIEAVRPGNGFVSIEEWCPGIQSQRGFVTMGFVGDNAVCCAVSDDNQWLIPFKDVGDDRHYLCGSWPYLDYVVKFDVNNTQELKGENDVEK